MNGFDFFTPDELAAIQGRAIALKGLSGPPDANLLAMAAERPKNAAHYAEPGTQDVFDLAAEYAFGIGTLHAFKDANKRTAFASCMVFLLLHGIDIAADDNAEAEDTLVALAQRQITVQQFAAWLRSRSLA